MPTLAALITVYHGNDPAHLASALTSLATQSRPADEVVVVADGPLNDAVQAVVDGFVDKHPTARLIALPDNRGAGPASQAGLETISADYTARLDADDIAAPTRFERQLAAFAADPDLGVVGTAVAEFTDTPTDAANVRSLPETHPEIARYAKINSPVNNPSVMFRTADVTRVGGYRNVHFMEDYDLYARLLAHGVKFANLPEPLTYFRVSDAQFARRTGREMFTAEKTMQANLVSYGLISRPRALVNLTARTAYRLLPKNLLRRVYTRLFHSRGLG